MHVIVQNIEMNRRVTHFRLNINITFIAFIQRLELFIYSPIIIQYFPSSLKNFEIWLLGSADVRFGCLKIFKDFHMSLYKNAGLQVHCMLFIRLNILDTCWMRVFWVQCLSLLS